jgi:hypothetical protein
MDQLFPNFVEASNPRELRSKMSTVSLNRGGTVNFFSVYYDTVSKKHVAWYHDKAENIMAQEYSSLKEATNAARNKK